MEDKEKKFSVGDKVLVMGDLSTKIEKVEYSEATQEYKYWFKSNGKLWYECGQAIELR